MDRRAIEAVIAATMPLSRAAAAARAGRGQCGGGAPRADTVINRPERSIAMIRLLVALLLAWSTAAWAAFPERPVRLVVGFAPGGSDIGGRIVAQKLSELWGQPVVVENKAGAAGNIGADAVAKAAPDGYTMLLFVNSYTINTTVHKNLSWDLLRDFAPVGRYVSSPMVVVVNDKLPVKSLRELIDYAKAHPGKLNFGSAGSGTAPHLVGEQFALQTGMKMVHVPYKGSAPSVTGLLADEVEPAGVLVEIIDEDGTMARLPQLLVIAKKFDLKIISIKDLIEYRLKTESLIQEEVRVQMPTKYGVFELIAYRQVTTGEVHMAMKKGEWKKDEPVLVRVHSSCMTGDILGSLRCDCGEQLHHALEMIETAGKGVVLYMNQEGRGIGLINKLKAYKLQEEGMDTVEANLHLGFGMDERDYGVGAQILRELGVTKMKLLSNNPKKRAGLLGYGLEVTETVPIEMKPNKHNEKYLFTKRDKLGHEILNGL